MKRFLSSAIYMVALFVAMSFVACNEYDEEELSRPSRTYEVIVKTATDLTFEEATVLADALHEGNVDTSAMQVLTNNIGGVATKVESRLQGLDVAMMIGFRTRGEGLSERYAAKIVIGNYNLD